MTSRPFCLILLGAALAVSPALAQETEFADTAEQESEELDKEQLRGWIQALGSEDFRLRQTAQEALQKAASRHADAVSSYGLATFFSTSDPELRYRLRDVLYTVHEAYDLKRPQGFLGIQMRTSQTMVVKDGKRELKSTVLIDTVVPDTAAERVDLRPDDQLLAVDDVVFSSGSDASNDFMKYVGAKMAGDVITLHLLRGQEEKTIEVALGERPEKYKGAQTYREQQIMAERFEAWLLDKGEKYAK